MKLTSAIILLACLHVSAGGFSQSRISIKFQDTRLKRALAVIERKTDYRFLYNDALLNGAPLINEEFNNTPVPDVLNRILQKTGLSFELLPDNLIVLKTVSEDLQQVKVTGKVLNERAEPIVGASVRIKGSNAGAATDINGDFSLTVPDSAVLIISYIGYETQEVPVNGRTQITVTLQLSTSELNQVVVVGYGTQRKLDVTGSVAQVKGEDIAKQASVNPVSSLQGKVAGVQITNAGTPGAAPDIKIRGLGTYSSSEKPLYVVDGVWVTDLSFLNPQDIESISILKDASSEAIYGVRGANGVVLITTKKGTGHGRTTINYNGSVGYQVANNIPEMANAHEYAIMFNELTRSNGGTNFLDSSQFGTGTKWFDQALRNALITNHQVSVNGGSEKSTYNLSFGYLSQDGVLKTNDYNRYTVSFNNEVHATKDIKVGYTVIGMYSKSHDAPGGIWRQLYTAPPVLPVKFADGVTYGDPGYYGLGQSVSNPQVTLDYTNATRQNYHLNGNAYAEIKFLKHFTLHSSIGGIYEQDQAKVFTPIYKATSTQSSSHNTLTLTDYGTRNWIVENTLTYTNRFGDHRVTALIGQTAYRNYYDEVHSKAEDGALSSDPNTWYLGLGSGNSASNVYDVTPSNAPPQTYPALERVSSYFGRVTYSYKDRYTVTGTLRSDASTKFTNTYGRAYLPSVGAAWVVSNEGFMANQHIFNTLKLRGSWGVVGNSGVPVYVATQTTTTSGSVIFGNSGTISNSQSIASAVPPILKWEKGEGTDIGLEAGVMNNRLNIEADYYIKNTQNFVFPLQFVASNGYTTTQLPENIGKLRNRGIELTLTWNDEISHDFSYSISGNLAYNENKFVENNAGGNQKLYSGGAASTGAQQGTVTTLGEPIGQFYGYRVIGIFQTAGEVANYMDKDGTPYQPTAQPGDFKYAKTTNGGIGAIGGNDRVVLGDPNPKYIYGINTTWNYKSFDLSLDFNGVADVQLYNANKGLRYGNENFTEDFYKNRWHGQGTSNSYPSVNLGGGQNYYINSWYVENGSYFRIRNAQLGYTFPKAMIAPTHIQSLRVFVNAQNPVIFTRYTGFSPEVTGGLGTGSPGNIGIDSNVYPIAAIYNFGVNLTF